VAAPCSGTGARLLCLAPHHLLLLLSPRRKSEALRDGDVLLFVCSSNCLFVRSFRLSPETRTYRALAWQAQQCWLPHQLWAAEALLGQSGQCTTYWWRRGLIASAIQAVLACFIRLSSRAAATQGWIHDFGLGEALAGDLGGRYVRTLVK